MFVVNFGWGSMRKRRDSFKVLSSMSTYVNDIDIRRWLWFTAPEVSELTSCRQGSVTVSPWKELCPTRIEKVFWGVRVIVGFCAYQRRRHIERSVPWRLSSNMIERHSCRRSLMDSLRCGQQMAPAARKS
jgi:hypothetical protein